MKGRLETKGLKSEGAPAKLFRLGPRCLAAQPQPSLAQRCDADCYRKRDGAGGPSAGCSTLFVCATVTHAPPPPLFPFSYASSPSLALLLPRLPRVFMSRGRRPHSSPLHAARQNVLPFKFAACLKESPRSKPSGTPARDKLGRPPRPPPPPLGPSAAACALFGALPVSGCQALWRRGA